MRVLKYAPLGAIAALMASSAGAAPLTVVNVSAPAVNCVFASSCTLSVTDTIGVFPPSPGYTGTPRLQTRTFDAGPGTPAAGLHGYVYRVDFSSAVAAADINCVEWLKVAFGPAATLPYGGAAAGGEVFVVTGGGVGSIGLASADKTGSAITFHFSTPVCPKNGQAPGQSSFFFGLASKRKPVTGTAQAQLTYGGGVVSVADRAPGL